MQIDVLDRNKSKQNFITGLSFLLMKYFLSHHAGTGSVLNLAGDVEMDAIIMEGQNLKAGSVAGVKNIRNPIDLARMVMDKVDTRYIPNHAQ